MKILIMSDLHFEQYQDRGISFIKDLKSEGVDVLVLAGDILSTSTYSTRLNVFKAFCDKYPHVVFVAGNHEMYGNSVYRVENQLMRLANDLSNLHILDSSTVEINGQRFIGATGWFKKDPDQTKQDRDCMGDFWYIENFVPWVYQKNKTFNAFLKKELKSSDICISHHLPSYLSIHPIFKNDRLNQFFVNNCEKLIKERQPKLFIHGHTHFAMSYNIGNTKVICNPKGYLSETNYSGFNPYLTIDV